MKKISAIVLTVLFAAMQVVMAEPINTGVGNINSTSGGFAGLDSSSTNNNVGLNFTGNSHVNWDSLNVNKGQSLNFNAINGANGLTILNTVNRGMTTIAGQINANSGIAKLIISNPNGVLFDGAQFATAGDTMITTQNMTGVTLNDLAKGDFSKAKFTNLYGDNGKLITVAIKNNSTFDVGGDYNIVAAGINAANSTINAKSVKLVTANGQDYLALQNTQPTKDNVVARLSAMNINGDLYVTNDVGAFEIASGGTINGNTQVETTGNVILNKNNDGKLLTMNGNANIKGNGAQMFLRNAKVDGNLEMTNGGGFLDVGNVHVTKNATLKTENLSTNNLNNKPIKHFVHVVGDTKVDGDLTIESKNNIHIGNYNYEEKKLLDGSLTVGGDLTAHAQDGHVMTTIDTKANKISLKSDNLNVLTDGKATLTANEYEFSSKGYIGGLGEVNGHTVDEVVIDVMERYQYLPNQAATKNTQSLKIAGGNIVAINTPTEANILSKGDVKLTGANAGTINITAPDKFIEITGNVHANEINVGKETDKLKVDYEGRDFVTKYTNIRDGKQVTIQKDEKITYNLTNAKNGYNDGTQIKGEMTYLVGPDAPVVPTPPEPQPDDPNPPVPDDNENVKVLHSYENRGLDLTQVHTPVAYAADLDDDNVDTGVRKNVDGSVTVVRAFPMIN